MLTSPLVISSWCNNVSFIKQLNGSYEHLLDWVLICYIECYIVPVFIDKWHIYHCHFANIDFVNIYCQIAYIEYQIVTYIWSTNPIEHSLHISFLLLSCSRQVHIFGGCFKLAFGRTIFLGGDLWRGNYLISLKTFASSKPQVTGDVSPGPKLPK